MKREYIKPAMREVKVQQQLHILAGSGESGSVRGVSSDDGINWKDGGFTDTEDDM